MSKRKRSDVVAWVTRDDGYVPVISWRGFACEGTPRPFPQFLEGERLSISQYLMCLAAEEVFGEAPLTFDTTDEGISSLRRNEAFDELPFLRPDPEAKTGWSMSDGNPDLFGLGDILGDMAPNVVSFEPRGN